LLLQTKTKVRYDPAELLSASSASPVWANESTVGYMWAREGCMDDRTGVVS